MHQQRFIHRDVKPENILVDSEGFCILSDFGISGKEDDRFTTCCTPEYAAPEIIKRRRERPDLCLGMRTADWWTVGCTLYEMVVGSPPFKCEDFTELEEMILTTEPEMMAYFEDETIDFLEGLLKKDPE